MAETRKHRDTASAQRSTVDAAEHLTQQAQTELNDMGDAVADTVARTADAAMEMSQRVAAQGREVMLLGVRAAAGMNGRNHRMLGTAARALAVYRDVGEQAGENLQALFSAGMTVSRGMQQFQHACVDLLDHVTEQAAHSPQDLLRARTLEEFAEVQRDLYLDAVTRAVDSSNALLQIMAQTAQTAMRQLQARTGSARS
jgi:hypothetical protein